MARNEVAALRAKAAEYKASIIASKAFSVGTSKKIRQVSASIQTWSQLCSSIVNSLNIAPQPPSPFPK